MRTYCRHSQSQAKLENRRSKTIVNHRWVTKLAQSCDHKIEKMYRNTNVQTNKLTDMVDPKEITRSVLAA